EFEIDEPGQYFGELTIFSNDSDTPELLIPLSSECILPPVIHCNPLFIDLTITSNQIHEGIMILSNIGESDLNCELAIIDSSQFAGWLEVSIDSCVIQPNDYEDILISFDPDGLEVGQYTAEIVIYHNDPSQDELIIPITMTLNYTNTEDNLTLVTNMLIGNYPNPFNPETTISFNLTQTSSPVTLEIFNLKGQRVREFKIENSELKTNSIVWDGTDQTNNPVSSGIYFYKLKTENYEKTKRMVLLK
ncbi:MAG: T9SS type A sorting domain-containing protein, partial [Candidatus Cloacimonetes bacterium]|nr:T9SS type A sorting domain-containing protein [Candidatus Cloacimonadota bacterium]